jgi:hypothetical protein
LEEHTVPTTPPEFRVKREKYATSAENIAQNIHIMRELLEKSNQLWTQLLEDGILQDLQGQEDKFHATMVDVKKQ